MGRWCESHRDGLRAHALPSSERMAQPTVAFYCFRYPYGRRFLGVKGYLSANRAVAAVVSAAQEGDLF